MSEPDYEQIMQDREQDRDERWLDRMDRIYGRVEDWRRPTPAKGSDPPGGIGGSQEGP